MDIDPETLNTKCIYEWMIGTLLPRPIAWISTVSGEGVSNLAPYSFFQGVCARPPTLMFCPVNHRDGSPKDTLRNIRETGEFVVNLVRFEDALQMNQTSKTLPFGESELDQFKVDSLPSIRVRPVRVATAPVAFECRLDRIVVISEGPAGGNAVFGRILRIHVEDSILGTDGRPDPDRMDLIGRVGGSDYVRTRDRFTLDRPS
ncbi:MAG: flavin reductase family protein [Pedosphaera sp.]|nr:flavin reductase family protein [Pedosphaera sp.]